MQARITSECRSSLRRPRLRIPVQRNGAVWQPCHIARQKLAIYSFHAYLAKQFTSNSAVAEVHKGRRADIERESSPSEVPSTASERAVGFKDDGGESARLDACGSGHPAMPPPMIATSHSIV
jgi:hypothetical protein